MPAPWFKVHSRELLTDAKILELSHDSLGKLLLLWCFCNENGFIPASAELQAKILHITNRGASSAASWIRHFFVPDPTDATKLVSIRLQSEQKAYQEKCDALRQNGMKGGRPQKPKGKPDAFSHEKPKANQMGPEVEVEVEKEEKKKRVPAPQGVSQVAPDDAGGWLLKTKDKWPRDQWDGTPAPRSSSAEVELRWQRTIVRDKITPKELAWSLGIYLQDSLKEKHWVCALETALGKKKVWADYLTRARSAITKEQSRVNGQEVALAL